MCRKKVEVEESSWKLLADCLDDFPAVLEARSVHLELMALVLGSAEEGTFDTCHNHFGAAHIFATVAQNLHILCFYCW
jgi:hypothetical protein